MERGTARAERMPFPFNLTWEHLLCALMIIPFFEPLSFNIFVTWNWHAALFRYLADLFQLGRAGVSALCFLYVLRKLVTEKVETDLFTVLIFIHMALIPVSCIMNGSADLKIFVQIFTHLGFIIFCAVMLKHSPGFFLESCVLAFGIFSIVGCASIFLHPSGYITGEDVNTYYMLGGKNTAFPYYFCFLLSMTALTGTEKREVPRIGWLMIIFIIGARITDSSSTTACLALLLLIYLIARYLRPALTGLRPAVLIVILAAAVSLIYMGMMFPPFVALLSSLGRNASFTGRDTLWQQAIDYFRANPLFGSGENLVFTLKSGDVTNHAHSQYLNRLAKYGLVPFVFLAGSLAVLTERMTSARRTLLMNLIGSCLIVYLLHMSFDDYSYNFFLLTVMIANYIASGNSRRQYEPVIIVV